MQLLKRNMIIFVLLFMSLEALASDYEKAPTYDDTVIELDEGKINLSQNSIVHLDSTPKESWILPWTCAGLSVASLVLGVLPSSLTCTLTDSGLGCIFSAVYPALIFGLLGTGTAVTGTILTYKKSAKKAKNRENFLLAAQMIKEAYDLNKRACEPSSTSLDNYLKDYQHRVPTNEDTVYTLAKKIIGASEVGLFLHELPNSILVSKKFEPFASCEDAPKIPEFFQNMQLGTLLLPPQEAVDQLLKMNMDDLKAKQDQIRTELDRWQVQVDEYLNKIGKAASTRNQTLLSDI